MQTPAIKVAVIEDSDVERMILTNQLLAAGFEVAGFAESDEAERVLGAWGVDVIISDGILDTRSIVEGFAHLKRLAEFAPVICWTAARPTVERSAIEGIEVIGKSDDFAGLISRIKSAADKN